MLEPQNVLPTDESGVMRSGVRRLVCWDARREWLVRQRSHPTSGEPQLVFESHDIVRVVRRFPTSWRMLSDQELEQLSQLR